GLGDLDLVVGQRDRRDRDVLLERAALPGAPAGLGAADVPELADDPAGLARRRPAVDVGEADVLVDLLAAAHLLLLRRREPHELRVLLVDREREVLPGLAAVVGEDPRAPVAHG